MRNINHLRLFFQIKREISTMKLIKHPNVVQLHEVYYFFVRRDDASFIITF
jgi:serine/threonine protein kinase